MPIAVILGGGFAGLTIANKLAIKLKKRKEVEIVLIEPADLHLYEPGLLYYPFNDKPMSKLEKPISKILRKSVKHIKQKATKIDYENKKITLEDGEVIDYNCLVIATGVDLKEKSLGLTDKDNVHHFYSAEATLKIREALKNFKGGNIVISPTTVPYKCPPAPIEFAFLLDEYLRRKKIRDKTNIKFLYPLPRPFNIRVVSEKILKLFEKKGIEFEPFFNYDKINTENKKILSFEGDKASYDLLVIIPPHEGQDVIKESGLGDKEGFVITDRETLQVEGQKSIYAVGDCTNIPASKAGTVAHFSADVIVKNLISKLDNKEPTARYDGKTLCFLVTSSSKSFLLDFSFKKEPRKIGLHSWCIYGIMKKLFQYLYFGGLITGRI